MVKEGLVLWVRWDVRSLSYLDDDAVEYMSRRRGVGWGVG